MLFDVASFLHLFNFMILGKIMKDNYIIAFLLGILWEVFEYIVINQKKLLQYDKIWNETLENKKMDIVLNIIGYHIGNYYLK